MAITYTLIICGNEILIGKRQDKHIAYITKSLLPFGLSCEKCVVVGDKQRELELEIKDALTKHTIILVTGGLGPTLDDITREAISAATQISLYEEPAVIDMIQNRFNKMGRTMRENNKIQALVPEQGFFFPNHHGTAPGLLFDVTDKIVIALPGPPRELIPMIDNQVIPYLKDRFNLEFTALSHSFYLSCIGESTVDHVLREHLEKYPEIELSSLARLGILDITLTTQENHEDCHKALEQLAKVIRRHFSDYLFSEETPSLEETVGKLLIAQKETVAIAESCTGGLISAKMTDIAGSSAYFIGGAVTYSNQSKIDQLGVKTSSLEEFGAVSKAVATEMAIGVRQKYNTDWGMSITGIAGPGGGTEEKPVGTVWMAVSDKHNSVFCLKRIFSGNRTEVRERSCIYLLDQLRRLLTGIKVHVENT